jgi:hypothetical protein
MRAKRGDAPVKISNRTIAIMLILAGYIDAALFYSTWIGIFVGSWYHLCPLCPNVDYFRPVNHVAIFIRLTLVSGTLNALVFSAVGWPFIIVARWLKKMLKRRRPSPKSDLLEGRNR